MTEEGRDLIWANDAPRRDRLTVDFWSMYGHCEMTEFRESKLRGGARTRSVRGLRFRVLDPRSPAVRRRIAQQVARLDPKAERDAVAWIEPVSKFDAEPEGLTYGSVAERV
jgi:hypothetical protein